MNSESSRSYPAPAYLNFCPGGISVKGGTSEWYELANYSNVQQQQPSTPRSASRRKVLTPDTLVAKAKASDDRLRQYCLLYSKDPSTPHYLPSLSALAGAVFGRLTGVPANAVRRWADVMVAHYLENSPEYVPSSEQEIYDQKPNSATIAQETTTSLLKRLLNEAEATHTRTGSVGKPRPCGYVFKRGDIAWNCRTCQTDPTCVICDNCFRNSNHDGHEVYFHRTTPGGCCDCGDAEAWKSAGCCELHRPLNAPQCIEIEDGPEEAVKMAFRGLKEGLDTVDQPPTQLPTKLAAALAVVVGAAVNCLVDATDGAGIGADTVQWKMRWADEACRIINVASNNEEYYTKTPTATPHTVIEDQHPLPRGYRLDLRLHNDDVHTFDEVIEALHEPRHRRSNGDQSLPLVAHREDANDMTHHVDADGQVTVKWYANIPTALQGYKQLKSKGLHCAVVSSAQVDCEHRARALTSWLAEISTAHPAAAAIVVHALVKVAPDQDLNGIKVWHEARMIPSWCSMVEGEDEIASCRRRFYAFPPHLESSYLTREEAETLHRLGLELNPERFVQMAGTDPSFYSSVAYRLPSARYRKSPHSLWGTLPATYSDGIPVVNKHQLLYRTQTGQLDDTAASMPSQLLEQILVVDTDLRKQQESELILTSTYTHKIPGLNMISGVGCLRMENLTQEPPPTPKPMEWRNMLAMCSFRAPLSPIVLLLLLDPYPTKQLRGALHSLFLSLLVDSRFKCRFAAALGAVAYRPLSTLFCAGVGTETDTPLGFTVQIFTAGSLVRALGNSVATRKLLEADQPTNRLDSGAPVGIFSLPIAHCVLRCIHTNLLGSTKEVNMILNNTPTNANEENDADSPAESLLPALTYQAGEHPLTIQLPAAPDDGFLDSRSTRHKRLPHLLRDLEYIMETPGTAFRLLLPQRYPVYSDVENEIAAPLLKNCLSFQTMYARLLRTAQGMDPQKRKISGGHVEYEQNRWLEAFGLSLNFAGTRDALSESLTNSSTAQLAPFSENGDHLEGIRKATGNLFTALLRELKLWLYREGMLETGLPLPLTHSNLDHSQIEALQRSTLHFSNLQTEETSQTPQEASHSNTPVNSIALACATGVKMTEAQLDVIENSLQLEGERKRTGNRLEDDTAKSRPAMGDWLRTPHSPLGGDTLSFHLPLHRSIAKCVRSICYIAVPESTRRSQPNSWWKLPVLDDEHEVQSNDPQSGNGTTQHPLATLIRPTLRSSNCRVVWSAGPDCTSAEAQWRRSRAKNVSANIASAKIIHSLADHPIRCLAAAQQIERHLWARNGSSTAGMALNYSSSPLCRSFRDLDITLVQLSAAGLGIGLGARRIFSLLKSRFNMDGYLCDPERRVQGAPSSPTSAYSGAWVNPPRLQDPDHAVALSDSFFSTMCILVTELPCPPPSTPSDDSSLRAGLRRELLHALAAEPRSHSEAMEAATSASSRRDESAGISGGGSGGGALGDLFTEVLRQVGKQKSPTSARAASGPSAYELRAECCDEYDPSFYHLRRQDHQHAMDTISRLRKIKATSLKSASPDDVCLPIVCTPPKTHPRFLSCRLLLHLPDMDAALRRSLLFAITGGKWLPPSEPTTLVSKDSMQSDPATDVDSNQSTAATTGADNVPVTTFNRRSFPRSRSSNNSSLEPFSASVVALSSVSCLEVLQLLTLQVHTLEECASLHLMQPDVDDDAKALSSSLSINRYLGRLIHVPVSLVDAWALKPHPVGPLPSKGSGKNRGSILGLLVTLYEHRSNHEKADASSQSDAKADEGHGGARALTESGLKWLLRFVYALVDGAPNVSAAIRSATLGIPIRVGSPSNSDGESTPWWVISEEIRETVVGILHDLPNLWPKEKNETTNSDSDKASAKNKEARKAAQQRVMEMMRKKQNAFAETIAPSEAGSDNKMDIDNEERDLCIICRCDDTDGENNGPLGYLGHVQRSRYAQMRASNELSGTNALYKTYRVAGHRGCQLRKSSAMDSEPLVCLPTGSIVTVVSCTVSDKYDVLSRRVFVRHSEKGPNGKDVVTEGWASVQSAEGYVILSPLSDLCFSNTRWGSTRPIILQCGHAAHMKCVETHTLSLHQRAAGEQPYDGRFAANIEDREFLCPLCKQLSNILIPRDGCSRVNASKKNNSENAAKEKKMETLNELDSLERLIMKPVPSNDENFSEIGQLALRQFGDHLVTGMTVPWERATASKKRKQQRWNSAIQRWDYEETDHISENGIRVKNLMSLLRQQHIAWSALGHSAASKEAATRSVHEETPFGVLSQTNDPWPSYTSDSRDSHPMLMELRRTMAATTGLFDVLLKETKDILSPVGEKEGISVISSCLKNILFGKAWISSISPQRSGNTDALAQWSQLTALVSSIPCHVSRDGTLSQRHEARACATAMWAVKGLGASLNDNQPSNGSDDEGSNVPSTPLAIRQILRRANGPIPMLNSGWGTMQPSIFDSNTGVGLPFRPAIACAYLYVPLLAWDMNTFAGALFSTMLGNGADILPSSADLLFASQILLMAKMIQTMITPLGFELGAEDDNEEYLLDFWLDQEIESEGEALHKLFCFCTDTLNLTTTEKGSSDEDKNSAIPSKYHGAIGRAILPFGRSLVLLLRACSSAIRQRQKKLGDESKLDSDDKKLNQILVNDELMSYEDGILILREFGGPLPSTLEIEGTNAARTTIPWHSLIKNWLLSLKGFEAHHGSRGNNLLSDLDSSITFKPVLCENSKKAENDKEAVDLTGQIDQIMDDADSEDGQASGLEASDDDIEQSVEVLPDIDMENSEDEMVGFAEQALGDNVSTIARNSAGAETYDDSSDDGSLDKSPTSRKRKDSETEFAFVSRAPIIPHQPSILGTGVIGPGTRGAPFEVETASSIMRDLSHLGIIHRKDEPTHCLIRLPKSFVELYGLVNKVKGREGTTMEDNDDVGNAETAICLLTGSVMRSGSPRRTYNRSVRPPGTCTLHARQAGSGIGIFFLVQKCTVLLMHNNKSAYSASVYVDQHGEEDPGLRRGRPLFLNEARYKALETLWRQQGIPREVAQIRSTSDRVIRDNWY
mmetsp:Transcript_26267/g.39764  ORF Transcript_26267/g.39764 Transcript_26267/m.39764 type:complete len:3039 (+) Transcript_26267:216-9332(+)